MLYLRFTELLRVLFHSSVDVNFSGTSNLGLKLPLRLTSVTLKLFLHICKLNAF